MAAGTDGNDYSHRERVADQYSVSATNKARLKFLVVLHLILGVIHNVRLVPFLLGMFGLRFPALPVLSSLPPPLSTEYLWLASLPFTFMALSACKKSRGGPLQVFQAVILLCCISSSLLTLGLLLPDSLQYILEGRESRHNLYNTQTIPHCLGAPDSKSAILGVPFAPLWSVFLLFNLIVHLLTIIVSRTLVQAWAPRHGKRS